MAQPIAPLFPPMPPAGTRYVLQIKVIEIDGTRSDLRDLGFRRFVQGHCAEYGLSGFVWRIPHVHGKILACGLPDQLDQLLVFVEELRCRGYIKGSLIEKDKQDYYITANTFIVLPSSRPRVFTGKYSDPDLDDVVSTGSDILVLNSPVPLH